MSEKNQTRDEDWDAAIAARLRRLGSSAVDTSALAQSLAPALNDGVANRTRSQTWWAGAFRPRAIAASIALIVSVVAAVTLTASSAPAYAEASQMAAMHRELASGTSSVMRVDSLAAAERALSSEWPRSPGLPGVPDDHVMACCLRRIDGKKIACVLMDDGGAPVSMMVAEGGEVNGSRSATLLVRGGVTYRIEHVGELNMVMTQRDGRFVCLIGERSVDRLIELSSSLRF